MNSKRYKFTCSECGTEYPLSMAYRNGDICNNCVDAWEYILDDTPAPAPRTGRNDRERFEFSGTYVEPARMQAHLLSY